MLSLLVSSRDAVRPSDRYIEAIRDFPTPKNITDVRSWFGLLNQVSYTFSMATRIQPFRQLLKPNTLFRWDNEINELFEASKVSIISDIISGVKIFDKSRPTCLSTDWSKQGIGFWLSQKHCFSKYWISSLLIHWITKCTTLRFAVHFFIRHRTLITEEDNHVAL